MTRKKSWELREDELLAIENAYIKRFNTFELIIDNHLYFILALFFAMPTAFAIGFAIGSLL